MTLLLPTCLCCALGPGRTRVDARPPSMWRIMARCAAQRAMGLLRERHREAHEGQRSARSVALVSALGRRAHLRAPARAHARLPGSASLVARRCATPAVTLEVIISSR